MRAPNTYEPLNDTHRAVEAGEADIALPEPRYEPLRETERQVEAEQIADAEPGQPDDASLLEEARAWEAAHDGLALDVTAEVANDIGPELDDHVAPEEWTHRGGMVEQQNSAMEWLEQSADERAARETAPEPGADATELTADDQELLATANAHEAIINEQAAAPSQAMDHDGP